ncbi:MAG: hypothetical protein JSR21_03085 [Proteobacteria bacterium]|nr:hypothetical protein [Pseudomonadota bacterium]
MLLIPTDHATATAPPPDRLGAACWIDAVDPTPEEAAAIHAATGIAPPTKAQLTEIESSSRIVERNGVLMLSLPLAQRSPDGEVRTTPLGIVVNGGHMITVRFDPVPVLEAYAAAVAPGDRETPTAWHAMIGLLEQIVDSLADMLERSRGELDAISRRIFAQGASPVRGGAELSELLRLVGRAGEDVSAVRDTLLVLGRLSASVARNDNLKGAPDLARRVKTMRSDIASLADYDAHVSQKVQFLLDAVIGLINIAQANVIKLMTVVGVIGVPPTLIASIYGMNFAAMPELHWHYGYPMALAAIAISAILPLFWFRRLGWL